MYDDQGNVGAQNQRDPVDEFGRRIGRALGKIFRF
jgi:hypothetical protein